MARILCCDFPGGVVWSDRTVDEWEDYKRLAFLPYETLELRFGKDCPPELRDEIAQHALYYQERRGQEYPVSTCGQTVRLGGR